MAASVRSDVHELEITTEALITLLDHIGTTAHGQADVDLLVRAVPCCVEVAGLLAALAGRLGGLAASLADLSRHEHAQEAAEETMADIAADLSSMRSLLHRVTLIAAPTLADLRRIPAR
jgi:hypothetical protein